MTKPQLPVGWRVDLLDSINAVQFISPRGAIVLWHDGRWTVGGRAHDIAVADIPPAASMKQARRVGTAFIAQLDSRRAGRRRPIVPPPVGRTPMDL